MPRWIFEQVLESNDAVVLILLALLLLGVLGVVWLWTLPDRKR